MISCLGALARHLLMLHDLFQLSSMVTSQESKNFFLEKVSRKPPDLCAKVCQYGLILISGDELDDFMLKRNDISDFMMRRGDVSDFMLKRNDISDFMMKKRAGDISDFMMKRFFPTPMVGAGLRK